MNTAVNATLGRSPLNGTLTDADVKALILCAARAQSMSQIHGVIKRFARNRLALVQVIESLAADLTKSRVSTSSQFDVALLDQLKLVCEELDATKGERDEARRASMAASDRLTDMERRHDLAQRAAERVQRELLLVTMDRERIERQNTGLSAKLEEKTTTLQHTSEELAQARSQVAQGQGELAAALGERREAIVERNALRVELASATSTLSELRSKLIGYVRLVADLKSAVKRHVVASIEQQRILRFLSAQIMTTHYEQGRASATPVVAATAANVVAFASRADLEKLREQVRSRDSALVTKEHAIAQLSSANGAMRIRLSEVESRLHQVDAASRAQDMAHSALAKMLLEILPAEQREIYAAPSYDAASLMLIADAVKNHVQETEAVDYEQTVGLLRSS